MVGTHRSVSQLLIDFIIETCGGDYLRETFATMEKAKTYCHNGCDAAFPRGTKICPKCKMPLR